MRILMAHPGAELYGADRVTLESATGLVEAGHEVLVALPERGPLVEALEAVGARVTQNDMFVLRKELLRPQNWLRLASSMLRGARTSWRLLSDFRPDVAYVSTVILPQWPLLTRIRRIPTVTHVHEAESESSWPTRALLYGPQLWSTTIVANSAFTADLMKQTIPRLGRRLRVIPNPVPGPDRASPLEDITDSIRVAFVGRLSPRKAPDAVIAATAMLREQGHDIRLEIVGDVFRGYEWYSAELDAQIALNGMEQVAIRHGYDPYVWPHLASAHIIVVPSRTDESFGNAAVEAVLAQRPVVISDLRGLREAVADYPIARVVNVGDAAAIAAAITELAADWPQIRQAAADAASMAAARHAPQIYRRSLESALRTTVQDVTRFKGHSRGRSGENG